MSQINQKVLNEIINFSPELTPPEYGTEPSFKEFVKTYYKQHVGENDYQSYVDEYFESLFKEFVKEE